MNLPFSISHFNFPFLILHFPFLLCVKSSILVTDSTLVLGHYGALSE